MTKSMAIKSLAGILAVIVLTVEPGYGMLPGAGPVLKGLGRQLTKSRTIRAAGSGVKAVQLSWHSGNLIRVFGPKAAGQLSKMTVSDTVRLVQYARKADTPAAKTALLDYYRKGGSRFLDHLSWDRILAYGMGVSMITSAYQVSKGTRDGITTVSRQKPEVFSDMIAGIVKWGLALILLPAWLLYWRRIRPNSPAKDQTGLPLS